MAHRALQRLPEPVVDALWKRSYRVFLRESFDAWGEYENGYYPDTPWSGISGYWDEDIGYAVLSAKVCARSQGYMDAVVAHEFGHAISINILGRPHRDKPFRDAWKIGRDRVRERWPADYESKQHMGQFCLHWTRGVQEVWAEGFAWMLGARARDVTHPAFGEIFAECIDLVGQHVEALHAA